MQIFIISYSIKLLIVFKHYSGVYEADGNA